MKTTQPSSNKVRSPKGIEKKSLPVDITPEMMRPKEMDHEAGYIRRKSVDQIKFRPRIQSVPELRGLQRKPSVCYYQYAQPPVAIPINQSELTTNGKQARIYTPVHPPPTPYYRRPSQIFIPCPPQYYYAQRYYTQRLYYPYPPFPQR